MNTHRKPAHAYCPLCLALSPLRPPALVALLLLCLVAFPSLVLADGRLDTPEGNAAKRSKSPHVALTLSLGFTLIPVGTGVGLMVSSATSRYKLDAARFIAGLSFLGLGLIIGPSIGHFYGRNGAHAGWHILWRALAVAAGVGITAGITAAAAGGSGESPAVAGVLAVVGLSSIPAVGLAIWDIVAAPLATERLNKERRATQVALAPLVLQANERTYYGVGLEGRF